MQVTDKIQITNEDNMLLMARYPDNYFDLAIVDPPYGINMDGGNIGGNNAAKATNYIKKNWDISAPNKDYFIELKRVSKNVRWLVAERRIINKHYKHKRIINQRWQSSLE